MSWSKTSVSPDGTHHLLDGAPLYARRFEQVLKFHAPGLAPALDANRAWHIILTGEPAYERRFQRVFGFYEGRAAVVSDEGWSHIDVHGADVYPQRYAWCGNFQESRCPVRVPDGRYRHIDLNGQPVGDRSWRYAGDYRDGVAVVQSDDGLSTHVDANGKSLHECRFLDLDVFHKGFARARDSSGWMHIDRSGSPLYRRRFSMVEPFYNGQARVERQDGALEIIDEAGATLVNLRGPRRSDLAALSADLVGFWRTQTLYAAVELGIVDGLPCTAPELAVRCGLDPDRARRILRGLGELEIVEDVDGRWELTDRGRLLRSDHPQTLADAAREYGTWMTARWRALPSVLRADHPAVADIFAEVSEDPARVVPHHRMLGSYAQHDYPSVLAALEVPAHATVVDAGGGVGVLAELLLRARPDVHVVVLDREEVIRQASVAPDVQSRFTARSADIFQPWPQRADAVVLSRVLHDWDDERALKLLSHARAALPRGGQLYIVEMMPSASTFDGALCDLHLLLMTGGQERTADHYAGLVRAAGFVPGEVRRWNGLVSVLIGRAP